MRTAGLPSHLLVSYSPSVRNASLTLASLNGSLLTLTPVASKIAFPTASIVGLIDASPGP